MNMSIGKSVKVLNLNAFLLLSIFLLCSRIIMASVSVINGLILHVDAVSLSGLSDITCDFNNDNIIDLKDLRGLASQWLSVSAKDLNGDQVIDLVDFSSFSQQFNTNDDQLYPNADVNGDGIIDLEDLRGLASQWLSVSASDLNGDQVINLVDFSSFSQQFNKYYNRLDPDTDSESDHARINAAFSAFGSQGGIVFLAPGNYELDAAIVIPSNCTLTGCGSSTRITVTGRYKGQFLRAITNKNGVEGSYIQNTDPVIHDTDIVIRDLYIDGGKYHHSIIDQMDSTIHIYGADRVRIENVEIYHGGYLGIMVEWTDQVSVAGCHVSWTAAGGIGFLRGTTNFTCSNNVVDSVGFDDIIYFDAGTDEFAVGERVYQWGIRYDGETGNFQVGEVVTGGKHNYTATITKVVDSGTSGVLWLADKTGDFQNDEVLTGSITGAAVANGRTTSAGSGKIVSVTLTAGSWETEDAEGYLVIKDPLEFVFSDNCQLNSSRGKALKKGVMRRYTDSFYEFPALMPGSCYKAQDGGSQGIFSSNIARNSCYYGIAVYCHPGTYVPHDIVISNNVIDNCVQAVYVSGASGLVTSNVTVTGNDIKRDVSYTATTTGPYGVATYGYSDNVWVDGNNIKNMYLGCFVGPSINRWVFSNNHANCSQTDLKEGFRVASSAAVTDLTIQNNEIHNFTSFTVIFDSNIASAERVSIVGNSFTGGLYGVYFGPTSDKWTNCMIGSNVFSGTRYYNAADGGSNSLPAEWMNMD